MVSGLAQRKSVMKPTKSSVARQPSKRKVVKKKVANNLWVERKKKKKQ